MSSKRVFESKLTFFTSYPSPFYIFERVSELSLVLEPQLVIPADSFLKSMTFQVRVPVLSLKIYSIQPNSSFKLYDYTFVGMSFSTEYIETSQQIFLAQKNFTTSNVTNKEIGTILVKSNIHVPNVTTHTLKLRPGVHGGGCSPYG